MLPKGQFSVRSRLITALSRALLRVCKGKHLAHWPGRGVEGTCSTTLALLTFFLLPPKKGVREEKVKCKRLITRKALKAVKS